MRSRAADPRTPQGAQGLSRHPRRDIRNPRYDPPHGDTVTLLGDANQLTKIRLTEIDAPEMKQPYGKTSKRMLSDLIYRKDVTVITKTIDKYGRTVGRIYVGETDVNLSMVKQGGAWAYRKYLTDNAILAAENHAKAAAAGFWGLQAESAYAAMGMEAWW